MNTITINLAGNPYQFKYDDKKLLMLNEFDEYIPFTEIVLDCGMWIDESCVRKSIEHKLSTTSVK